VDILRGLGRVRDRHVGVHRHPVHHPVEADPMTGENVVIVIDWVLIVGVIALVIAVYWMIGKIIDNMLSFWRAHKEDA